MDGDGEMPDEDHPVTCAGDPADVEASHHESWSRETVRLGDRSFDVHVPSGWTVNDDEGLITIQPDDADTSEVVVMAGLPITGQSDLSSLAAELGFVGLASDAQPVRFAGTEGCRAQIGTLAGDFDLWEARVGDIQVVAAAITDGAGDGILASLEPSTV